MTKAKLANISCSECHKLTDKRKILFKLPKIQQDEDYKPEFTPELQTDSGKDGEEENSGVFTETLARIYIKQGKYQRAYEIISRLHQQHPDKNGYYVDQLRFLEKLMLNSKKK